MGKLKAYYMDLEERHGELVDRVVQIIDLYPELVKTKMLVMNLTNSLPKLQIAPEAEEAVRRAECKDILVQEMCEILSEDRHTNFVDLLRWLDNKDEEVDPIY